MRIALAAFALLPLLLAGGSVAGTRNDPARTLLAADSARVAALVGNDIATLDNLLADDLSFGHTNAQVQGKKDFIDDLRTGVHRYKSLATDMVVARVYGCAGVITGKATVNVVNHGTSDSFSMRYTATYVRRRDQWALVAYQSVRIP